MTVLHRKEELKVRGSSGSNAKQTYMHFYNVSMMLMTHDVVWTVVEPCGNTISILFQDLLNQELSMSK